jgi:hypothetical protein
LETVGEQYFVGMDTDGAIIKSDLPQRTWADVLKFRQDFSIRMTRPMPKNDAQFIVCVRRFRSTPLGVQSNGDPYLETRERR